MKKKRKKMHMRVTIGDWNGHVEIDLLYNQLKSRISIKLPFIPIGQGRYSLFKRVLIPLFLAYILKDKLVLWKKVLLSCFSVYVANKQHRTTGINTRF